MHTRQAGVQSDPPTVLIQPAPKVDYRSLYEKCWNEPDYRKYSPGQGLVKDFWVAANPKPGQTLIDWGCGTGRAGHALYKKGLNVTLVDFAENCLDEDVRNDLNEDFQFVEHDLTQAIALPSHYGYCCDVLEHIPEDKIDEVLDNILENSRFCFFQISCMKDHFGTHPNIRGDKEREHLHVTVHDYQWWLQKFVEKKVIIYRSNDLISSCIFYLSGYGSKLNLDNLIGQLNTSEEEIISNIRYSATLDIPSMQPHQAQDIEVMLLAGGPTLNDFDDEIAENRKNGMPLITVNGSYRWAIARGLKPSLQCLIDSRDFNFRFTEQFEGQTDETKFLVSSSANPKVFDDLPKDRTFLWHVNLSENVEPVLNECFGEKNKDWWPVPGGSTVTLRALCALRMLGFNKIHIYGLDGCIFKDKQHHAYEQPENDRDVRRAVEITVAGGTKFEKTFLMAPWMISQAQDFMAMVPRVLSDAKLKIYGDGAIAYIVEAASQLGEDIELKETIKDGVTIYEPTN